MGRRLRPPQGGGGTSARCSVVGRRRNPPVHHARIFLRARWVGEKWIRSLAMSIIARYVCMGHKQLSPTAVWEINDAATAFTHGREQSKRAKHYQMKVTFLNEQHQRGVFGHKRKLGRRSNWVTSLPKLSRTMIFSLPEHMNGVRPPTIYVIEEGGLRSKHKRDRLLGRSFDA